jgi:hypothetical protein
MPATDPLESLLPPPELPPAPPASGEPPVSSGTAGIKVVRIDEVSTRPSDAVVVTKMTEVVGVGFGSLIVLDVELSVLLLVDVSFTVVVVSLSFPPPELLPPPDFSWSLSSGHPVVQGSIAQQPLYLGVIVSHTYHR